MTDSPFDALTMTRGPAMKNRFMLAPLTNCQSHADGQLSDDEFNWLTKRAAGGFGLTMTCAAHVQAAGQGFPGQLGVFANKHVDGLKRLADEIHRHGSTSSVQLHHAGMRSPEDLIGQQPLCPSADEETNARALTTGEVEQLIEDFVTAAERTEKAGFQGAEIHGAHGYIVCQFLSAETNRREDKFGGSLENRSRVLFEIIDGIRDRCGGDFQLGVRLSPERFGLKLTEITQVAQRLMRADQIDYLDMSLWDVFKEPAEPDHKGRSLASYFTELDRGNVRLGVAGKITRPEHVLDILGQDIDFALLGRAAIAHHDFPNRMAADAGFEPVAPPIPRNHLFNEGLSETFVDYLKAFPGFVEAKA